MGLVVFDLEEAITPDPSGPPMYDPIYAKYLCGYAGKSTETRMQIGVVSRGGGEKGVQEGC